MFRKIGFGAAAALTVGMLAVGCSEDGDTIVTGGGGLTRTDNFPGSQVDSANLADDGRAFSPSGANVQNSEIFWNTTTGEAIAMFVTQTQSGTQENLYAAYFNGSSFTAPVQIRGVTGSTQEDTAASSIGGYKVLWLNTAALTDPEAREKDGDAIILFTRNDLEPSGNVTSVDEDANRRLWFTQFDRSMATAGASGTFVNGFNTAASTIDTDNQVTGNANDPGVDSFGVASDSLEGTHAFTAATEGVTSGNPTTSVWAVYRKDQSSGGTDSGPRWMAVFFQLNEPGFTFQTANTTLNPASGTISTGDNTANEGATSTIIVADQVVIYEYENINDTDQDDSLTAVSLAASGTAGAGISLGSAFPTSAAASNDDSNLPDASDVYYRDHGLTSLYVFFREVNFGGAQNVDGNRANDEDLMLAKIDNDANGNLGTTRELQEVDAFTGTIDVDDGAGDGDGFDIRPGDRGAVTFHDTRINRTGQYITVLTLQNNTDQEETSDTTLDATALNLNQVLRVFVVQTRRDSTARTLANSVSSTVQSASQTATGIAAGGTQANVTSVAFQQDLADGQAVSQGGQPYLGCVFQSNRLRMNWTYQQRDDQQGGAGTLEDNLLLVDGVNVTLNSGATVAAPTITTVTNGAAAANRVIVARVDEGDDGADNLPITSAARAFTNVIAVDAGDTTTTGTAPNVLPSATSGRVLVFYVSQGNNADSIDTAAAIAGVTGFFVERRLFAWDAGNTVTLSSDPSATNQLDYQQVDNAAGTVRVIQVPVNENIASSPSHSGDTIHAYWEESITRAGNNRLATRAYQKEQTQATTAVAFGERFNPDASGTSAAGPVFIDNPFAGDLNESVLTAVRVFRTGSTVGVFSVEEEHLYYQEISSNNPATGYYLENGVAAPQLVDNESAQDLDAVSFFRRPECDDLNKLIVVMTKDEGSSTDDRILIRVRN